MLSGNKYFPIFHPAPERGAGFFMSSFNISYGSKNRFRLLSTERKALKVLESNKSFQ
jgi:hypothetical protein